MADTFNLTINDLVSVGRRVVITSEWTTDGRTFSIRTDPSSEVQGTTVHLSPSQVRDLRTFILQIDAREKLHRR